VGIPGGKRPITTPRPRWDDDSIMGLTETRWKVWSEVNSSSSRYEQLARCCEGGNEPRIPQNDGNFE
jgi:hypothetical protein